MNDGRLAAGGAAPLLQRARDSLQRKDYVLALQYVERAIADFPHHGGSYYIKGRIHNAMLELGPAILAYRRALELDPTDADAWTGLGMALRSAGQMVSAVDAHRRALVLVPDHPTARHQLGKSVTQAGAANVTKALGAPGLALVRQADDLGRAATRYHNAGEYRRALDTALQGLLIAPDGEGLLYVAASAASGLGMRSEAFRHFDHLARVADRNTPALYAALSLAFSSGIPARVERYAAILSRYEKDRSTVSMLRQAPALALPVIQESRDTIRESRERYEHALDTVIEEEIRLVDTAVCPAATAFFLAYHGENDRALQVKAAQMYARSVPALGFTADHCDGRRRRSGRIRVGLASHYFYLHSIGKTSRGLIERFDRNRFEVFVIRFVPAQRDAVTDAIRRTADHFIEVDWATSSNAVQRQVAALELDVLFYQDIGMEPVSYFLAFARLAPVQCVSFGHPNTTGIPTIDYFVSNDLYETPDSAGHYSETLFELRGLPTLAYYHRPAAPSVIRDRPGLGLPARGTLYLCPQALFKFHPDFDEILRRILERDPAGYVVLIRGRFSPWYDMLSQRLDRSLGDLAARILALNSMDGSQFMNLLAVGDVMLDTLHFNGMNSSLEAFAVGLPVVTLPTSMQRGRHTRAMYLKMGIPDCIATDVDSYVDIAVRLGSDPDFNRDLRARLNASSHVLYEDIQVVREFERFFETALAAKNIEV